MAKLTAKRKGRKTIAFGAEPNHIKLIEKCMKKFGQTRPDTMRRLMTVMVNEYDGIHLSRTTQK